MLTSASDLGTTAVIAAPSDAVRAGWAHRITTEYVSGVFAQDHARRLTYVGASPDLIEAAFGVASDELRHASLVAQVSAAAGGDAAAPIAPELLALPNPDTVLTDLVVGTVQNFCIAETVATRLFRRIHAETTVPLAREVLDEIVTDEPRHGALGWATLDWLLDSPWRNDVRELVRAQLAGWLARYDAVYSARPTSEISADDRAWGVTNPADAAATWRISLTRDLGPRFAKRGFVVNDV